LQQWASECVRAGSGLAEGPVEWQIGSPIDELMLMLIAALNANPVVSIGDRQGGAQLRVEAIRIIPPPQFNSPMRFKTLSPIFAAVTEWPKAAGRSNIICARRSTLRRMYREQFAPKVLCPDWR